MQSDGEITYDVQLGPGETLSLPSGETAAVGPGHWLVSVRPIDQELPAPAVRDHSGFLNSYVPEDEGLYDDYSAG
jgi:hypothetical protein